MSGGELPLPNYYIVQTHKEFADFYIKSFGTHHLEIPIAHFSDDLAKKYLYS